MSTTVKDTVFYDAESSVYSDVRYPATPTTYTQWFFKRRLHITLQGVASYFAKKNQQSLLEIGCADGVVMRAIVARLPGQFSTMIGLDISPKMIEEARAKSAAIPGTLFYERKDYVSNEQFDLVLEVGVIGFIGVEQELPFVLRHLKEGGIYILSIAGKDALGFRLGRITWFGEERSYREYEAVLKQHFTILSSTGCGLFVPYLWRLPALARIVQPIADMLVNLIAPQLCHEKIYLLKKRSHHV